MIDVLTELEVFLLARLREQEALARVVADAPLLAQTLMLHALLELHRSAPPHWEGPGRGLQCDHCRDLCHSETGLGCEQPQDAAYPCSTVITVAAAWSEHPDWRPGWIA